MDTLKKLLSLDTLVKLLDTIEDVVIISDKGKVPRLIMTLASILIAIVVDTTTHSETSVFGNPTPGITFAISFVIEPFATDNDATDFANILSNFFGNSS